MNRLSAGAATVCIILSAPTLAAAPETATAQTATAKTATPKPAATGTAANPGTYPQLAGLFADWRMFVVPAMKAGVPDYSPAAMARMAAALPGYRQRLKAIDTAGWPLAARIDQQLVEAEMNGLDFHFRVLKPWARDPTFYANVFGEQSDVPAHEGSYAEPNIDLYTYRYPLNKADEAKLTALLGAVPATLAAAKLNLKDSNARDLWTYGDRAFKEQSAVLAALAAGTLVMRTLEGHIPAVTKGAGKPFLAAANAARIATDDFAAWVAAQVPKKTGPSGVGKDDYNWYVKNVELMPYDWDQQTALLQRELDRSLASLRLEEARNKDLPPITPIEDAAAFRRMAEAKTAMFNSFIAEKGLAPDTPEFRAAMAAQTSDYAPPDKRNFFSHVTALDPLPLLSHSIHWIDLARMKHAPHASPIRRVPALYNIYANRSEGYATAFEEIAMQAGLYDKIPHGRELVWAMLANRAARGLASLHVQANTMDLDEAGKFHAEWTPRGWSDRNSPLVGFEQLLYARQPGYGPSYVTGKLQIDRLMADVSHADEQAGRPFVMADFWNRFYASGIIPVPLIAAEMLPKP